MYPPVLLLNFTSDSSQYRMNIDSSSLTHHKLLEIRETESLQLRHTKFTLIIGHNPIIGDIKFPGLLNLQIYNISLRRQNELFLKYDVRPVIGNHGVVNCIMESFKKPIPVDSNIEYSHHSSVRLSIINYSTSKYNVKTYLK